MKVVLTILLSLCCLTDVYSETYQLKQLIVVSRHGIRAQQQPIPAYRCGLFDLNARVTQLGHRQNYALGEILATQYGAEATDTTTRLFESATTTSGTNTAKYDWSRHIFYATDSDKNLMSGNSVAQGLYKKYFESVTMSDATFAPSIPVRIVPPHVLDADSSASSCSTLITQIQQQILQNSTDFIKGVSKPYAACLPKIQAIAEVTNATDGKPIELKFGTAPRYAEQNILATGHLKYMEGENPLVSTVNDLSYDDIKKCLYYDKAQTTTTELLKCPDSEATYTDAVMTLATARQQLLSNRKYVEMAKLRTSPFIHFVYDNMKSYIVNNTDNARNITWYKFIFMLGENGNVQNLMQLFKQPTPGRVPFGSSVAFELYVKGDVPASQAAQKEYLTNEANYVMKVKYRRMSNSSFNIQNVIYDIDEAAGTDQEHDCGDDSYEHDSTKCQDYIDWTPAICNKDYCAPSDMLNLVYTMDEWRSKCITDKNADAQYWSDELKSTKSSLESELADTEDDKKMFRTLFIVFLVVLLVLLVVAICIIVLQCCGCIGGSSSSKSSSESNDQPMESI